MSELKEVLDAVNKADERMGKRVDRLETAIHSRVGRLETSVAKLGETTGAFQVDMAGRMGGIEQRTAQCGVACAAVEASRVAGNASQDAKDAGRKAGGLWGILAAAAALTAAKIASLIPWGRGP